MSKRTQLFQTVDFGADGLRLTPREYATLLAQTAREMDIVPDVYSSGGLIADIERDFAARLGKESAVFMPTGTLANHLALRRLAGTDSRVIVQAESHVYNDSGDGASVLSGLNLIPLAPGRATISLVDVKNWIERTAGGRAGGKVGVISIESPVRRCDHEMFDFETLKSISAYARTQGIRLHMDGARMATMPLHSGHSLAEYAALFDTVYISLKKHFNGACGAILAGDRGVIEGLAETRRMFGASLHDAWPEVALVPQYARTFEGDYARAWASVETMMEVLAKDGRLQFRKIPNSTSRFVMAVPSVKADVYAERLRRQGIVVPRINEQGDFLLQVNPTILRRAADALAAAFIAALSG